MRALGFGMDTLETRAQEAKAWEEFERLVATVPDGDDPERVTDDVQHMWKKLLAEKNYHALQEEEKWLATQKSGIARSAVYRGGHDTDVGGAGGGKTMPFSGLYRPKNR